MKDYQAQIEKLRADAAERALIRDLATDKAKRETFDRLAAHLDTLSDEVEKELHKLTTVKRDRNAIAANGRQSLVRDRSLELSGLE